jgi:hypothetical protein
MDPTTNQAGTLRGVEPPTASSIPSRFVVRRGEDELVVVSRRRFETAPRAILVMAGIFAALALCAPAPGKLRIYWGTFCIGTVLWLLAKFWGRTTLRLRGLECWVTYRGMFSTRRLHGTLRSLDVVGIIEMDPPPKEHQYRDAHPIYCLHLWLAGSQAMVFRAAPRLDLEWLISEVRDWRHSHEAGQQADEADLSSARR